jgi:hypothetical protein
MWAPALLPSLKRSAGRCENGRHRLDGRRASRRFSPLNRPVAAGGGLRGLSRGSYRQRKNEWQLQQQPRTTTTHQSEDKSNT